MANTDAPLGFQPSRHANGGVIRANEYPIASAYGTAIFTGDTVVLTSGKVNIAAENSATILGVFAGVKFTDAAGEVRFLPYWPAGQTTMGSVDAQAMVFDDPGIIYKAQTDTDTAYVDATHKGGSFDIELDHAGSTRTGQSGMEIDLADTGTGQILVLGLVNEPGNAAGVNAKVECMIRKALLKAN